MRTLLGCLALTLGLVACRTHRTILIPRFSSAPGGDAFQSTRFESEREVEGTTYALWAAAYGTTLHLAARTTERFVGDVIWRAGVLTLRVSVTDATSDGPLPVVAEGGNGPTSARLERVAEGSTITLELPHATLRGGDGTLVLEFRPAGGEPVVIPREGRLRGVYLRSGAAVAPSAERSPERLADPLQGS